MSLEGEELEWSLARSARKRPSSRPRGASSRPGVQEHVRVDLGRLARAHLEAVRHEADHRLSRNAIVNMWEGGRVRARDRTGLDSPETTRGPRRVEHDDERSDNSPSRDPVRPPFPGTRGDGAAGTPDRVLDETRSGACRVARRAGRAASLFFGACQLRWRAHLVRARRPGRRTQALGERAQPVPAGPRRARAPRRRAARVANKLLCRPTPCSATPCRTGLCAFESRETPTSFRAAAARSRRFAPECGGGSCAFTQSYARVCGGGAFDARVKARRTGRCARRCVARDARAGAAALRGRGRPRSATARRTGATARAADAARPSGGGLGKALGGADMTAAPAAPISRSTGRGSRPPRCWRTPLPSRASRPRAPRGGEGARARATQRRRRLVTRRRFEPPPAAAAAATS